MFSVVIPTKNEQQNIKRLLLNLKAQTTEPNQIIVADKSTDGTGVVAKRLGAKVVRGVDDGRIGRGRNLGARHAKTDILVFLDADVVLPNDFFERAIPMFVRGKYHIATCKIEAERKKLRNFLYFKGWHLLKKFGYYTKNVLAECGACMIVWKRVFEMAGGFSESISVGEDADFVKRVIRIGGRYKILPVKIRVSDRRISLPVSKFAVHLLGLAGIAAVTALGVSFLARKTRRFEKMYGQLGGEGKKEKKQKEREKRESLGEK
ncbi:glycosyltransferase [Candidatus Dojkabacteria bacterium]|nr:glycosyltransferase [Candidatus Dojkabacteria bacterium]